MLKNIPDYFIEPLLYCAHYSLGVNHSFHQYTEYFKSYSKKAQRYDKYFKDQKLIPENFYQEDNAFLIISGQKADAGKILYCSKQTKNILGGDDLSYTGTNINTLFLPKTEIFNDSFFRAIIEGGDTGENICQNLVRTYMTHKDGHMVEIDYYINIHPNVTQGLHLSIIIRPVVTATDCIMVRENGDIEGMTRKISRKLRFQRNHHSTQKPIIHHIQSISPDLNKINRAYNAIHFHEKIKPKGVTKVTFSDADFASYHLDENDCKSGVSRLEKLRKMKEDSNHGSGHQNDDTYYTIKTREVKKAVDQSIKMDLDEAIDILEKCSGDGQEIVIYPFLSREQIGAQGVHFSCRVMELQQSIKVFALDEIRKDKEGEDGAFEMTYSPTLQYDQHGITSLILKNTHPVGHTEKDKWTDRSLEFHSENFDMQEEREAHYHPTLFRSQRDSKPITFPTLHTGADFPTNPKFANINTLTIDNNNNPLLSPMSQGSILMSQASLLMSPDRNHHHHQNHPNDVLLSSPDSKIHLTTTLPNQITKTGSGKVKTISKVLVLEKDVAKSSRTISQDQNGITSKKFVFAAEGSVATSHLSKVSSQRKVSRIFKMALQSHYYSRAFRIIYFLFYILILLIFASQVYLKFTIDSTTDVMVVKKDILINAQQRTYQLSNVQSIFRQMRDVGTGRLTEEDQGLVYRPFHEYITLSSGYLTTLISINNDILASTHALDEASRSTLFYQDVAIYDTFSDPTGNSYTMMTSFQAIDRVLQVALAELDKSSTEVNNTGEEFDFISRNAINDLLLKNNKISDTFLESAQDQVDSIQMIIITYLIIELLLLAVITSLTIFGTWRQYFKEKKLMIGFIKPSPNEVHNIIAKINRFKKILDKDINFDEALPSKVTEYVKSSRGLDGKKFGGSNSFKKEHSRAPLFMGLWKRYVILTARWLVYAVFLIALIVWNAVLARSSMSYSHNKILQLDFTYRMVSRLNIGVVVASELVIPHGISPIQDVPTTVGMVNTINDIISLRIEIRQMLVNDEILKNSLIKTTLFNNGCAYLSSNFDLFCNALDDKAMDKSLMPLLSTFERLLTERWNSYDASTKTEEELKAIEVANYDMLIAVKRVILGGVTFIGELLSGELDNHLESVRKERNLIFGLFTGYLIVLSILAWKTLLNKLREANNEFKRVLEVLPAEIVLSNFLLKSFLIKTSLGTLDSVKDGV